MSDSEVETWHILSGSVANKNNMPLKWKDHNRFLAQIKPIRGITQVVGLLTVDYAKFK